METPRTKQRKLTRRALPDPQEQVAFPSSASSGSACIQPAALPVLESLPVATSEMRPAAGLLAELEDARRIQDSLLPTTFPVLPGFQLAGFCRSARFVGGDFYDVVQLGENCALLVVADVMGKGVPAALFAATLRTLVRGMVQWTQNPADMLARINAVMFEELNAVDMFITTQLAVVDAANNLLTVASAGHCPLLLADAQGGVNAVVAKGMPLGISRECGFAQTVVPLNSLSCALLYTDGLTDARNSGGAAFGQRGVESWLAEHACGRNRSALEIKGDLLLELRRFDGQGFIADDQTFLVLAPSPRVPLALAELAQATTAAA